MKLQEICLSLVWMTDRLESVRARLRLRSYVTPLALLETVLGIPYEELQATVAMLVARQLALVVPRQYTRTRAFGSR